MPKGFTATVGIEFTSDVSKVWKGLTDPAVVRQYFFGTNLVCDWKVGKPIYFRGEWEGKSYEDKGTILDIKPGYMVKYNYWSSMSGMPDVPENYVDVTYTLSSKNGVTILTIIQEGIKTVEAKKHSEENWKMVMGGLKKLLEK
jgi:uncharacterized protein YndB with AHSA1/START domain